MTDGTIISGSARGDNTRNSVPPGQELPPKSRFGSLPSVMRNSSEMNPSAIRRRVALPVMLFPWTAVCGNNSKP